jgi:hypothetical protein
MTQGPLLGETAIPERVSGPSDALSTNVDGLRHMDPVTLPHPSSLSLDMACWLSHLATHRGWSSLSLVAKHLLSSIRERSMLKITITITARGERWTLHGRLVAPWVSELKASWKREHETAQGRKCIVNLNEVTFIDKSGERMLRSMSNQGAQFVTGDLYIKHVVDRVRCKSK